MTADPGGRTARARELVLLVLLAVAARAAAAALAPVSDDLRGWRWVAAVLAEGGNPYVETPRLNWPPLWMLWIGVAGAAARWSGIAFDLWVRLLPFAADALIVILLARLRPLCGLLYALHPVALTTTGAQAQFDALPALALLVAVAILGRGPAGELGAGIALGLGAGFKTWPLFALPALLPHARGGRRRLALAVAAVGLPLLLVLPVALIDGDAFRRNVLGYRAQPGWWGLTALGILIPAAPARSVAAFAHQHGTALTLAALALAALLGGRLPPVAAALAALLAFLAVTPGFGPQYLLWLVPLALVEDSRPARLWQALAAAAVLVEFFLLPHLALPGAGRAAALAGNWRINLVRAPVYLAGLGWLATLVLQAARRRRPAAAGAATAGSIDSRRPFP